VVYLQRSYVWCHMKLLPSTRVLCTPYNHAPCHFMQSHTRKVQACLAVTCHLHFWQSDRDLLRATVVKLGWNGYRNSFQHLCYRSKLSLDKIRPAKFRTDCMPRLLSGSETRPPNFILLGSQLIGLHFLNLLVPA